MLVMINLEDSILAMGKKFIKQVCSSILFDDDLKFHLDDDLNRVFGNCTSHVHYMRKFEG